MASTQLFRRCLKLIPKPKGASNVTQKMMICPGGCLHWGSTYVGNHMVPESNPIIIFWLLRWCIKASAALTADTSASSQNVGCVVSTRNQYSLFQCMNNHGYLSHIPPSFCIKHLSLLQCHIHHCTVRAQCMYSVYCMWMPILMFRILLKFRL